MFTIDVYHQMNKKIINFYACGFWLAWLALHFA